MDLIKIDIDGAEPLIMDALCRLIAYNGPMEIIMEYAPFLWKSAGRDPGAILQQIACRGFNFHIIKTDGSLIPAVPEDLAAYPGKTHLDLKLGRH